MPLPDHVIETLKMVGQVAIEVKCLVEDYREFVSIYHGRTNAILNSEERFPYLQDSPVFFRCIRFRVESKYIEKDLDVAQDDMADIQEIMLPTEDAAEFVIRIWDVNPADLKHPRHVDIPV
jgi:hypothetical protein